MAVQPLRRRRTKNEVYWSFSAAMFVMVLLPLSWWIKVIGASAALLGLGWVQSRLHRDQDELTEELRSRERRIAMLIENAFEGIVIFDENGRIEGWNPQAEHIFGWSAREVIGEDVAEIFFGEEQARYFRGAVQRLMRDEGLRGVQSPRQVWARRRSGEKFLAEFSLIMAREENFLFAVLIRDLTEQRELQARMIQMDRLAAMGTLAAGVAHELNNPLSYVSSNVDYAVEQLEHCLPLLFRICDRYEEELVEIQEDLKEVQRALMAARQGADRMREIVSDMGVFSRNPEEKVHPVRVDHALELALRMTRNELVHRARLIVDLEALPCVLGDEHRLTQVFVNLLINAAHAIEQGAVDENEVRVTSRVRDGQVVILIADTGSGIEAELIDRIFDPFFTTKPVGQGTGLGLSLSRSFIEDFGGELSVESVPGNGSVFRIVLPSLPTAPETVGPQASA